MLERVAWMLLALYGSLQLVRMTLAVVYARRHPPQRSGGAAGITVLQPILSGDPTLEANLAENLANHPDAHFVWLIDRDDGQARAIAERLRAPAGAAAAVEVLLAPAVPQGQNPKVFKLGLGLPLADELVAVLDDDTVLPAGALAAARAALAGGDLVTGLPLYRHTPGLYSSLVAAFVNANALLTYLPILAFQPPTTVNGMFWLTRRATLEGLGGLEPIADRLCDDYELAKLYRRAGLRIVQTVIAHPLRTTVPDARGYLRILHRWMVFANQLFAESLTLPVVLLVILPSLLPLMLLALAAAAGSATLAVALGATLLGKAALLALLRARLLGSRERFWHPLVEVLADLVQPFHAVSSWLRPRSIRWRDKDIALDGEGGMRYR